MSSQPAMEPVLALRQINKNFGAMRILTQVDIDVLPGEVHAVLGENGAGKSTLLKIMSGVYRPDSGEILFNGHPCSFASPAEARTRGIAMIYQEPMLFPDLDVAENIFMGKQPVRSGTPFISRRAMYSQARDLLASLGGHLNPGTSIAELSVADQQLVEIAGVLALEARIVIMDEPTSALTVKEVENLFRVIKRLKAHGVSIVFVSHRLEEVFAIADRITVLRDGQLITTVCATETSPEAIIRAMVGRELSALFLHQQTNIGSVVLECRGLTRRGSFSDISFSVRSGEIVGLAGLIGAGRTEVARAIFGIDPLDAGLVSVNGLVRRIRSPRDAIALGLAMVPEDRHKQGLILGASILHNVTLTILHQVASRGWIRPRKERAVVSSLTERLRLKARDLRQRANELSGGNQQKVVLAKWLVTQPHLLILDEPTRGIDIGAKVEIHRLMSELVAQGLAILMISSDLPEVLAMCDRIAVMREGRIVDRMSRDEASAERIIAAATVGQTEKQTISQWRDLL